MSGVGGQDENDPSFRRQRLYDFARVLKERDALIETLNKELEDYETLKFNRERIDQIINELQQLDLALTSSSFSRVLHNVTPIDRAIVGVKSLVTLRPVEAVQSAATFAMLGLVLSVLYRFKEVMQEIYHKIFSAVLPDAYAAPGAPVTASPDSTQLYVILGFAALICIGFIYFAGVATLSKEASTRKSAMEMTKHVMGFMMGLVAGYLAAPR